MSASRVSAVRVESARQFSAADGVARATWIAWLERLFATDASWPLAVLRVVLATVMFAHGAQKALGLFGGYGFTGTMGYFTGTLGIPYVFGLLAILTEFLAPVALVTGFLGRVAAAGVGVIMTVAVITVHAANGFYMNWYGQQAGEGYEYHLLAGAIALAIVIGGSGALSLDRVIARRIRRR